MPAKKTEAKEKEEHEKKTSKTSTKKRKEVEAVEVEDEEVEVKGTKNTPKNVEPETKEPKAKKPKTKVVSTDEYGMELPPMGAYNIFIQEKSKSNPSKESTKSLFSDASKEWSNGDLKKKYNQKYAESLLVYIFKRAQHREQLKEADGDE